MSNLEIFCVTDKSSIELEDLKLKLAGVGEKKFSRQYINCKKGNNIQKKEKNYSELTFHYWLWKNKLSDYSYRRLKSNPWLIATSTIILIHEKRSAF